MNTHTRPLNVLLTNDDGITAPGMTALVAALSGWARLQVVAPIVERSACSHTLTLRAPLVVERVSYPALDGAFAVHGTPADCVRLAVAALLDEPPDLVVSGLNRGANAGADVYYSGTVAGAREAAILGIPGIAVSLGLRDGVDQDWETAARAARDVIEDLAGRSLAGPGFWNVNLPPVIPQPPRDHVHEVPVARGADVVRFTRQDDADHRETYRYERGYWDRQADARTDFGVIRDGGIAVSPVPLWPTFAEPAPIPTPPPSAERAGGGAIA